MAISSRALFNLDESHTVFEQEGVEAYCRYQVEREDTPLEPGVAFNLVAKLLALNERDLAHPRVEVICGNRIGDEWRAPGPPARGGDTAVKE